MGWPSLWLLSLGQTRESDSPRRAKPAVTKRSEMGLGKLIPATSGAAQSPSSTAATPAPPAARPRVAVDQLVDGAGGVFAELVGAGQGCAEQAAEADGASEGFDHFTFLVVDWEKNDRKAIAGCGPATCPRRQIDAWEKLRVAWL